MCDCAKPDCAKPDYLTFSETPCGPAMLSLEITSTKHVDRISFLYTLTNSGIANINSEFFIQSHIFGKIPLGRQLLFSNAKIRTEMSTPLIDGELRVHERARGFCEISDRTILETYVAESFNTIYFPRAFVRGQVSAVTPTTFTMSFSLIFTDDVPLWTNCVLVIRGSLGMDFQDFTPTVDPDSIVKSVEVGPRLLRIPLNDIVPSKKNLTGEIEYTFPTLVPPRARNIDFYLETPDFYISRFNIPFQRVVL